MSRAATQPVDDDELPLTAFISKRCREDAIIADTLKRMRAEHPLETLSDFKAAYETEKTHVRNIQKHYYDMKEVWALEFEKLRATHDAERLSWIAAIGKRDGQIEELNRRLHYEYTESKRRQEAAIARSIKGKGGKEGGKEAGKGSGGT